MGFLCKDDRPFMLSSSNIGTVSQCDCCESYHVVIGNITLRMDRKHLISLTQMVIEALEVQSSRNGAYDSTYTRNHA